jgi:hypothetical protein
MRRKAFDITIVYIPSRNPRQAKPVDEMLSSGHKHASGSTAVSQDVETIPVGRESEDARSEVFGDANRTAIFEETDEPANIRDVPRPLKLPWTITHATAPYAPTSMESEALHGGSVHLTEWKAMSLQPVEKMTSCTRTGFEGGGADLSLEILGQERSVTCCHATRRCQTRRNI